MNPVLSLLSQNGRRYRYCCFNFRYNVITTTTISTQMTNIRTFRDYRYDWDTPTPTPTTTTDSTKILLLSSHQQRSPLPLSQLYDVHPSLSQQQPQHRYFTSISSSYVNTTTRHTSSSSSSSTTTTTTPPTTNVPIVTITKNTLTEESNHNNSNNNNSVIAPPPHPLVGEERKNAIQTLNDTSSNGSPFQWEDDPTGRNAIMKLYHFLDFQQAFDFMTHVANIAEQMNHHPEWKNIYNIVEVTLSTHDCHGVSHLDIQLAQKMDEYANQLLPQRTSNANQ